MATNRTGDPTARVRSMTPARRWARLATAVLVSLALLVAACTDPDGEDTADASAPNNTADGSAPSSTTDAGEASSSTTEVEDESTTTTTATTPATGGSATTGSGATDRPPGLVEPERCRLDDAVADDGLGLGHVRPPGRLASTGTVEGVLLFVDFPDVAAGRPTEAVLDLISPGAEDFFAEQSYGRLDLVLRPHPVWLRLSQPSGHYGAGLTAFEPHRAFIAEAVELADPDVDFAGVDVVVVVTTPEADRIPYGPTWLGVDAPDARLEADGTTIVNGITSGADLLFWTDLWLPHELGHSLGLPDLYDYSGPGGFTRPFSVMDLINDQAPGFLAWSRWILGWLDDDQIACVETSTELVLEPVATSGGLAAAVIPLDTTRALVVESRRAVGSDRALAREGALVYLVDTAIASGAGPIRTLNGSEALEPGDTISQDGVTVTVLDASTSGDRIRVDLGG